MESIDLLNFKNWAESNFARLYSTLTITFDESYIGQSYTVSSDKETYTGTVDQFLKCVLKLHYLNTPYTITFNGSTSTVTTKGTYETNYGIVFGGVVT